MCEPTRAAVPLVQGEFNQTLQALADVDTGRVIDHSAVQAWANSLSTATALPTPYFSAHDE